MMIRGLRSGKQIIRAQRGGYADLPCAIVVVDFDEDAFSWSVGVQSPDSM